MLLDMLVELGSDTYKKHAVCENGNKLAYVVLLRAIYGILLAALLLYKNVFRDLENIVFEFNRYNPCVSKRIKVGKQNTVRLHVGDIISSHVNPKVNYKFK